MININNINLDQREWLNDVQNILISDGFCVVENVIDIQSCELGIDALKSSYKQIKNLIGQERLNLAGEVGVVRAPMAFDPYFFTLLENKLKPTASLCLLKRFISEAAHKTEKNNLLGL